MFQREARWMALVMPIMVLVGFVMALIGPPILRVLGVQHAASIAQRDAKPMPDNLPRPGNDAWGPR